MIGFGSAADAAPPAAPSPAYATALAGDGALPAGAVAAQANVQSLVNSSRRSRGLAPLALDARLTNAAQLQANYMASIGRMTHTGSGGSTVATRVTRAGYRWSYVGENIAFGQTSSNAVVAAWLASPPHAANIYGAHYTQMGLGLTYARGVYWWSLVLARPA
jgi:uncharacterized protein YkwD